MSFPPRYTNEATKKATRKGGEQTRQRAIDIAVTEISESGFHKMTIADVAAKTGVSQSGLLHHFPSKVALLAAVLEKREREDSEFLFGDGTTPLGWAAFDALTSLVARNSTRPEWVKLFVRVAAEATDAEHPAHEWITHHYQGIRTWLTDAVRHGIDSGEFRPDVPVDLVVTNTIAALDGIQQQWVIAPEQISMVPCISEHLRMLKAAWSAEPPTEQSSHT